MGCDIHLFVERREGSEWKRVLPPQPMGDEWDLKQIAEGHKWSVERAKYEWYGDRNYDCFAILANVRNGAGFAGVKTGDGFHPIAQPRGWPDDLSAEVAAIRNYYEGDDDKPDPFPEGEICPGDHSHSWLLLSELLAYNWDRATLKCGVISLDEFAKREVEGKMLTAPESWCGDVWGQGCMTITEAEARNRLANGGIAVREGSRLYVQVSWPRTYREAAGHFYSVVMPALQKLGEPENVRIVFGFDS